jgi:hypothetical protein
MSAPSEFDLSEDDYVLSEEEDEAEEARVSTVKTGWLMKRA